jgi:hypothetical protein
VGSCYPDGGRDADAASPGWDAPSEEARDDALIAAMATIIARVCMARKGLVLRQVSAYGVANPKVCLNQFHWL